MLMTMRSHLFPFRTQKLSSFVPKILGGRLPGKIGRCRYLNMDDSYQDHPYIYSSIAQLAEHAAVNRRVVCSSQTGGAIVKVDIFEIFEDVDFFIKKYSAIIAVKMSCM